MKYPQSLLSLAVIASFSTAAEQAVTKDVESITVTASGFEQLLSQAPASVSVIDRKQLAQRAYKDVTDALRDVPGVTVTGGGYRQDISIRGLPAQYTSILVDGKKQTGRESQPNGSGGYEQDWLPPLDSIERIEIVRGPMSTLYGSDAMGGVINIITRKNYRKWSGNLRAETRLQQHSDSGSDSQVQLAVSGPLIADLLSLSLSGLYQKRGEDDIERGYAEKTLSNVRSAFHLTPTKTDVFSLEYVTQDQTRASNPGQSLPETSNASETESERESVALTHEANYDSVKGRTYVQQESVENVGRDITIDNLVVNSQWSFSATDSHKVTLGAEYLEETLDDFDTNGGDATEIKNSQWAVYGEDEWAISKSVALTAGIRLDDNELFNSEISPRLYAVWNMSDDWVLKGGVSSGYRTPELREMAAGWIQESRGGDIHGNPELMPETTLNKELALYYIGAQGFETSVTVFHNDFEDKIAITSCELDTCLDDADRYNINIDEAESYGFELASRLKLEDWSFNAAYSFTRSEQKTGDNAGLPLVQQPKHLFTLNTTWTLSEDSELWSRWTVRSAETALTSVSSRSVLTPGLGLFDIGFNTKLTRNVKLQTGLYNLLDKTMRYSEYGYVEDGRRLWVGVNWVF
ncbi:Iron-regulated outer membrane virulence protein [Alteromonas sp. 38]|uniref:TonB-dependent receptor domain-containing protein n=1 Tax=unclassified Alteromonas TaxID=2614992 RepID=UPI0012EF568A|nr:MULTISPECIES: TonB-dependent receptor [unclassified Alteromonas]CAD5268723.1 Iron-regulated outer membrane virulence protein [Alteromonas sp. 154]VXC01801.1 Iron-regulated outer membrane virulence protein [Alteromonas sp. 38]